MFAHDVGDIAELTDKDAKLLIDAEYAEKAEKPKAEKAVKPDTAEKRDN